MLSTLKTESAYSAFKLNPCCSELAPLQPGLLQSAFLWGYGVTQVLGGVLGDKFGGARVLLGGLALWSLAIALIPASTLMSQPIIGLVAARMLFGAASGCALPASSSAVATYVAPEKRASSLSMIFTFFNCGRRETGGGLCCAFPRTSSGTL